ncbi:prisilkin-39-like [Rhopilema esculentum]|uniref:prisilkin-39-like n=1 Tax=Rhopilema esculentum TaxID=499914 RepID=UPI0031CE55DE|eukprot:gene3722-14997_t
MHLSVFVTVLLALYLVNADGTADSSSDSGDVTRSGNDETDGYYSRYSGGYPSSNYRYNSRYSRLGSGGYRSRYTGSRYTGSRYTGRRYGAGYRSRYTGGRYTGSTGRYTGSRYTGSRYTGSRYNRYRPRVPVGGYRSRYSSSYRQRYGSKTGK